MEEQQAAELARQEAQKQAQDAQHSTTTGRRSTKGWK